MISFVLLFALLLGVYLLYKGVRLVTDKLFPDEKNTNVKNATVIDSVMKTSQIDQVTSIATKYEMVKDHPLDYKEEDRKAVTNKYRDILLGRIKDPDGFHAPREREGFHVNPDYIRYLRNQSRVLGPDCWHRRESVRIRKVQEEENISINYRIQLLEMGAAPEFALSMTSHDERMEEYSADDWKKLIQVTNDYKKTNSNWEIIQFLEEVTDKNVLIDKDKLELFTILLKKDVPQKVAGIFVSADLSEEGLEQILDLLDQGVQIDEALTLILNKEKRQLESDIARKEMTENLK